MARNGSGTMTIPNTFSPGDTITSSGHNQNNTDIASEITNSFAIDGQSTMSGQFKAANGTIAAPAIAFGTDTDTGIYRKAGNSLGLVAGGTEAGIFDTSGLTITGRLSIGATDSMDLPNGTTAQRPASPVNGQFRFNNTLSAPEFFNGSWRPLNDISLFAAGSLADARLSANVPLKNGSNTFTGANSFQDNKGASASTVSGSVTGVVSPAFSTDGGPALFTFQRAGTPGPYAVNMGLGIDNIIRIGGSSDGNFTRWQVAIGGHGFYAGSLGVGTTSGNAGEVRCTGNMVFGVSDVRLKTNIKKISRPLVKINALKGVSWSQSKLAKQLGVPKQEGRRAGLIAQDLIGVLPEAVKIAPFDDENARGKSRSGDNYLCIQYEQVIGLLVEGIKELARKVEKLEAKNGST